MLGLQVYIPVVSFFLDFCTTKISTMLLIFSSVKEENAAEGLGTPKIPAGSDLKALLPKR